MTMANARTHLTGQDAIVSGRKRDDEGGLMVAVGKRPRRMCASPDDPDILEATAYHEAGHAAAAWRFDNSIRDRGIQVGRGDGNVHCRSEAWISLADQMRAVGGMWWKTWCCGADRDIITNIAGPMAESRYLMGHCYSGMFSGDTPDLNNINAILKCLDPKGESASFHLFLLYREARNFLRRRRTWGAICELATELIRVNHVSGEDAEALFERWKVPQLSLAQKFPHCIGRAEHEEQFENSGEIGFTHVAAYGAEAPSAE